MAELRTLGLVVTRTLDPHLDASSVASRRVATPPSVCEADERYLVAAGATGDWQGHSGQIARWVVSDWVTAWQFAVPCEGVTLWVDDEDVQVVFDGVGWREQGDARGCATYAADEVLSPLRVVRLSAAGHVVLARPPEAAARLPVGITIGAAPYAGAPVQIARSGAIVTDGAWAWMPGRSVLLDHEGRLTQQKPLDLPYVVPMGLATAPQTLVVKIGPTILLEQ